jgi:hypothetical protein
MSGELLPPAELAPGNLADKSAEERAAVWLDMLDAGYKLVLAGLRQKYGSDSEVHAAYRSWYAEQMADHDHTLERMLWRMQQRRATDAC